MKKLGLVLLLSISMGCANTLGGTTNDSWYTRYLKKASCGGLIELINENPSSWIANILAAKMHDIGCVDQAEGEAPSAVWKTSPTPPGESAPS